MCDSSRDTDLLERYVAIRSKISDQKATLAEVMRPFSDAIAALSEEAACVMHAHMTAVADADGVRVGSIVTLRHGGTAVVEGFSHWMPIHEDKRLPNRTEISVRMRAINANGKPGQRLFSCGLADLRFGNGIISS